MQMDIASGTLILFESTRQSSEKMFNYKIFAGMIFSNGDFISSRETTSTRKWKRTLNTSALESNHHKWTLCCSLKLDCTPSCHHHWPQTQSRMDCWPRYTTGPVLWPKEARLPRNRENWHPWLSYFNKCSLASFSVNQSQNQWSQTMASLKMPVFT